MIVVLTVFALVAVIVIPRLGGSDRVNVDAAMRLVIAGLRQARSVAVTTGVSTALLVDAKRKIVVLESAQGAGLESGKVRKLPVDVDYELTIAESERVGENAGRVRFFPDGSSTGGRVGASAGNFARRVDVDWLTGRIGVLAKENG
ncbi:MAG: general secretion pathway protein H [Gammaproteobacteria bacterium]